MKRIKKIEAFETPVGLGLGYIEPLPSFHPPSLKQTDEPKPTKLMQRLLKQNEEEFKQFRNQLLLKQPKVVMPMVTTVQVDQTPLNLPPLFASKNKTRKPVKYNKGLNTHTRKQR